MEDAPLLTYCSDMNFFLAKNQGTNAVVPLVPTTPSIFNMSSVMLFRTGAYRASQKDKTLRQCARSTSVPEIGLA